MKQDLQNETVTDSKIMKVPMPPVSKHHKHKETVFDKFVHLYVYSVLSLGVVFGDIGTSPLYVYGSVFTQVPTETDILGVLCLIFYAFLLICVSKYVLLMLNYDNKGEGGTFSLLSLLPEFKKDYYSQFKRWISVIMMIVASSFVIGDGILTPSISILSALEGLSVFNKSLEPAVVPIACFIVVVLFVTQSFGTSIIGLLFGPVILLWMLCLGTIGIYNIVVNANANVFRFFNPYYGYLFFENNKTNGFLMLGGVVLCITGVEAMYADIGHFGKSAVRISLLFIVFPCVMITYIGQAAFLINNPELYLTTFYSSLPPYVPLFWCILVLATFATIIASQAMISGAFSLISQAIQLNFFPRIKIKYTSQSHKGQVYIPLINYALMFLILIVIIIFKHSAALASAYGIAVVSVLMIDSFALIWVNWENSFIIYDKVKAEYAPNTYKWWNFFLVRLLPSLPVFVFLPVEAAFLASTYTKVPTGGWLVLLIAFIIIIIMMIWTLGIWYISRRPHQNQPIDKFLKFIDDGHFLNMGGTGVFINQKNFFDEQVKNDDVIPDFAIDFIKNLNACHENLVFIQLKFFNDPKFTEDTRYEYDKIRDNIIKIGVKFGFYEKIPEITTIISNVLKVHPEATFLNKKLNFYIEKTKVSIDKEAWFFQRYFFKLFSFMFNNSRKGYNLKIPPKDLTEIGPSILVPFPVETPEKKEEKEGEKHIEMKNVPSVESITELNHK